MSLRDNFVIGSDTDGLEFGDDSGVIDFADCDTGVVEIVREIGGDSFSASLTGADLNSEVVNGRTDDFGSGDTFGFGSVGSFKSDFGLVVVVDRIVAMH